MIKGEINVVKAKLRWFAGHLFAGHLFAGLFGKQNA